MTRVLVTGVGSLIGLSIIRSLKASQRDVEIYGADYFANAPGLYLVNKGYLLPDFLKPGISHEQWLEAFKVIIITHKIDLVLVGLDFEVALLAQYRDVIERETGATIVVADSHVVSICKDKYMTALFLKEHGFLYPDSVLPEDVDGLIDRCGFPLIVKPRFGFRSRGLSVVNTRDELPFALANCENPVIQQLVGDAAHEYTCGTLCDQQGLISTIALRRDLKDGNTIRAYWDESCRTLNPFLERIAQTLGAFGPLNIQLRLLPQGPVVFEINPRFSGTTYMRTLFGVNEIQRLIDKREGKLLGGLDYREGVALRFYEDVFIELDAYNQWVKP